MSAKVLCVRSNNSSLSCAEISKPFPKCTSKWDASEACDSHILANCINKFTISSIKGGNASLILTKAGITALNNFTRCPLDIPTRVYVY